jgi:hypothetical protein
MKTQTARTALRATKKHPRAASSVAVKVAKHPRETAEVLAAALHASRVMKNAAQPGVRTELSAAAADLVKAYTRARQVGARSASDDKKVARNLDTALDHLSSAVDQARGRRRRHTGFRLVIFMGAVLGAVYAAWKLASSSLRGVDQGR